MANDTLLEQILEMIIKAGSHEEIDSIFTAAENSLTQRDMAARRRFWRDLRERLSTVVSTNSRNQQERWGELLRDVTSPVIRKAQGGDALGDLYNYAKGQAAANARRA
jgi:hypothetical protein